MQTGLTEEQERVLYSNNLGKKSFQWELWQCCNNICKFCYLGKDNRHTNKERQLKSLADLKQALENLDFDKYNNISLIGGEFFQGQLEDPDVRRAFFEIIQMICDFYANKKIGSVWLAATLTIGDQADLYETVDMFDKAGVRPHEAYGSSGLWICTSWDAQGRFHTEKSQQNWEFHMKNLGVKYPWIKKNTTIIIMQKLCENYLSGKFVPHKFMDEFGTSLFYKVPGITQQCFDGTEEMEGILAWANAGKVDEYLSTVKAKINDDCGFQFFPDRKTFRKFLVKYAKDDADTFNKLFNIEFRADELHRNFNEEEETFDAERHKDSNFESSASTECIVNPNCLIADDNLKHVTNYATYSDCNACMMCDRNQVWESLRS